jgi:predicted phosphodiesterase
MTRTIFIWDIHGCFDEFIALLEKIKYKPETDQLYLTGDLINKWPKAKELLDFLIQNPQIKSVIWNNEVNFLRRLQKIKSEDDQMINIKNYEKLIKKGLFDKSYDKENPLFEQYLKIFSKEHIKYITSLPLYIETNGWILLHGWLVPWKKLEEHHLDEITRIRQWDWKPWYDYYTWSKTIIYGHWAADWLRIRQNTKWLDTGCVYGKRLTAYCYETWEIWQISAKKLYLWVE